MPPDHGIDPIAIDVRSLMQRTVASLYSHLVTRPTGRAVRLAIEGQLSGPNARTLSVIDLSEVTLIDFSCADEVVAKLLLKYQRDDAKREAFFVFHGVRFPHREPIEAVLERPDLGAVAETGEGRVELLGPLGAGHRRIWAAVEDQGVLPTARAMELGVNGDGEVSVQWLLDHRLLFRTDDGHDLVALSQLVRDLLD